MLSFLHHLHVQSQHTHTELWRIEDSGEFSWQTKVEIKFTPKNSGREGIVAFSLRT